MNTTILTVGSVTHAIKVRKLLLRHNITSVLVKIDVGKSANGCEYGIKLNLERFYDAIRILKNNEIHYSIFKD